MVLFFLFLFAFPVFSAPVDVVQFGDSIAFWLNDKEAKWQVTNGKDSLLIQADAEIRLPIAIRTVALSTNPKKAEELGFIRVLPVGKLVATKLGAEPWKAMQPLSSPGPRLMSPSSFANPKSKSQEFRFMLSMDSGFPLALVKANVMMESGKNCQTTCAADSVNVRCHAICPDSLSTQPTFIIQPSFLERWNWPKIRYEPIFWDREKTPSLQVKQDSIGKWIVDAQSQFSGRVHVDSLRIRLSGIIDTIFRAKGNAKLVLPARKLPWDSSATWLATWYSGPQQINSDSIEWVQIFPENQFPRVNGVELLSGNAVKVSVRFPKGALSFTGIDRIGFGESSSKMDQAKDSLNMLLPALPENDRINLCFALSIGQKICRIVPIDLPAWKKAEVREFRSSEGIRSVKLSWELSDSTLLPWIAEYKLTNQCSGRPASFLRTISKSESSLVWDRNNSEMCLRIVPQQIHGRQGFCAPIVNIKPASMYHENKPGRVSVKRNLVQKRWEQSLEWIPNASVDQMDVLWMDSSHNALGDFRWDKLAGTIHPFGINTKEGANYFIRVSGIQNGKEGPADTIPVRHPRSSLVPAEISTVRFSKDSILIAWKFPPSMFDDISGYIILANAKEIAVIDKPQKWSVSVARLPDGVYSLEVQPQPKFLSQSPGGIPRSLVVTRIPSVTFCAKEKIPSNLKAISIALDHAWRYLADTLKLDAPFGDIGLCPEPFMNELAPSAAIPLSRNPGLVNGKGSLGNIAGDKDRYILAIESSVHDSMLPDISVHELAHAFFRAYRPHQSQMLPWEEALATWVQWRVGLLGPLQQPDPSKIKDFPAFEKVSPQQSYPYWIRFKDKSDADMRKIITSQRQ